MFYVEFKEVVRLKWSLSQLTVREALRLTKCKWNSVYPQRSLARCYPPAEKNAGEEINDINPGVMSRGLMLFFLLAISTAHFFFNYFQYLQWIFNYSFNEKANSCASWTAQFSVLPFSSSRNLASFISLRSYKSLLYSPFPSATHNATMAMEFQKLILCCYHRNSSPL